MKRLIALAIAVLAVTLADAKPVERATAQRIASHILQKNLVDATPGSFTQCYLFTATDGKGFVLVSASDCVRPLLAYSHTETFPTDAIPSNLQVWLDGCMNAIAAAEEASLEAGPEVAAQWQQLLTTAMKSSGQVGPLLTSRWSQKPYYNSLCPYDEADSAYAVTGCVATAMAQIMRFWRHPATGMGSHSYQHPVYGLLSACFDTTHYEWSLMPDSLNAVSSSQEIAAVARICRDAGIAVNMNYSPQSSGAFSASYGNINQPSAENALKTHFRYSPLMQSLNKNEYTNSQWCALLRQECDNGQPVLYSGRDSSHGGHAFVLDGYDSTGLFHINWGWGGRANGFFCIDSLNPLIYSFSLYNQAIIGIRPVTAPTDSLCTISMVAADSLMGSVIGSGTYRTGVDTVNIIARANEGYLFSRWASGSVYNPNSFIANGSLSDTAIYRILFGDTISYANALWSCWRDDYTDTTQWGIRVPPVTHLPHRSLTEVNFIPYTAVPHELNIYVGDSICEETLVYHASISEMGSDTLNTWYRHILDAPLVLDSNSTLWITLTAVASDGYPATMGRYSGNSDGSWYHLPDGWRQLDQYGARYSWLIRAIMAPTRKYHVAATPNNINMGQVSGMGDYYPGDTCTLVALATPPYTFTGWGDGNTDNPLRFAVTSDTLFVAYFGEMQGIGEADRPVLTASTTGLTVTIDNPEGRAVALYDIMGRRQAASSNTRITLDLPAAGVYLLQAEGMPTRRIVVIK